MSKMLLLVRSLEPQLYYCQLAMLWMILLILACGFCNSQEFSNSCNGTEGCKGVTNCIRDYIDLEIYILNSRSIVETLARTFFTTGKVVSKFVKITYNIQTSNGIQSVDEGITNCSHQQNTYVWSKTALYLLGPKALYWFTLSAIHIDEVDVEIELPCLCNDVYTSLLSRLTYLVRVYDNKT